MNYAQSSPFNLYIKPLEINGLGGLQSYAWGQDNGKWLIIGGRLDGLHRRQPFAAFDVAGNNKQLIVVDPASKQVWTAPLTSLSVAIQEQLSSTNMEFHQTGKTLYLIGGYGYNVASGSKKTFDNLCAVNVPEVINAIINQTSFTNYFRQISHSVLAVTGGHLEMMHSEYYLIGGNRFDGNYNPMGNPTYTQVYTNAVQTFKILDNDTTLQIQLLKKWTDTAQFHRRDYNAVPQIMPNGKEGITAFSGVFQTKINLPYLGSVSFDSSMYKADSGFQQYYNQYHCAVLPMYSESLNTMHSVFFGGIAQYYDSAGILVQDNNVPFVNTIARVSRNANNQLSEYKLPIVMPALLGAGAEFILNEDIARFDNGVIKLDSIHGDSTLVGYIYGGISSTAPNVFFTNTGTQSSASKTIFEVYVSKSNNSDIHTLNTHSNNALRLQVLPNPTYGELTMNFYLSNTTPCYISITDSHGKLLEKTKIENTTIGLNTFRSHVLSQHSEAIYFISIANENESATQKVILKR